MAAQPTPATLLTADDLMAMPDDGHRDELVRGELIQLPMSNFRSSTIAVRITSALQQLADTHSIGVVAGADGAHILSRDPCTVRISDASFVRAERLPPPEAWDRFLELAPDVAVEVVSPWDSSNDVQEKVREYLDAGVRPIWVVHPLQRTITAYATDRTARVLYEEDTLDGGDFLPGFSLLVAEIFA
jgi:Uma2 family endonuclease